MTLKEVQEEVLANKERKGFNTTSIEQEFCYLIMEVGEAYEAYYKGLETFPEECADVALFLLGIAEIQGFNLEEEILKKLEKNKTREYRINEKGRPVHV